MTIETGNREIEEILNDGTKGLQYWIQLVPRYEKAFGSNNGHSVQDLEARYDEQRGMKVRMLESAADGLGRAADVADKQYETQNSEFNRLGSLWQGNAANAGQEMFRQQLTNAQEDKGKVRAAKDAIKGTIGPFREAVKAKAEFTAKLVNDSGEVRVDGKSPEDIDTIIEGAKGETQWFDSFRSNTLYDRVGKIFPDLDVSFMSSSSGSFLRGFNPFAGLWDSGDSPYAEKVKDRCQNWLNDVFKKDYEQKLSTYVEQCKTTNTAFETQYTLITKAMADIQERSYPRPADEVTTTPGTQPPTTDPGQPTTTPGTNPPSTTPGTQPTTTPGTTPTTTPGTTPTTTTNPTSLDGLASLSQAAQQLSSTASTVASTVTSGLSSLGTTIASGVEKAIEEIQKVISPTDTSKTDDPSKGDPTKDGADKNGADKNKGAKPVAEFDLAGKHLKLEMKDGQLKLVESAADGKSHEYTLKLDEHGMPVITTEEKDANPGDTPPKPDGAQPKPDDTHAKPDGTQPKLDGTQHPPTADKDKQEHKAPAAEDPQNKSQIPTPPVPPTKKEDDGEHRPKVPSGQENQQPKPSDSGAELAEAGPL
ncbi:hypothetical protein [Nocardia arthritidis]|uniref:Uncharacterized protein n=1 Tax=Nocardia arthritidis TaxID=228602 RepID=A0A6G9Y7P1_9NOCA|nr:hypothetical protein [Nocardia arthritidis]QIS09073.1 hypothetical protein F5544_05805 [Nocardia arthritidis]